MIEMRWAESRDREAIIDFIDYVFSKNACPHDFPTLLPKLYGDGHDTAKHHFIILEDGKIVANVLAYPVSMVINGKALTTIGVGSVSVHPRARGRGYMTSLLGAVDARAKELGAAFSVLGGQRQRYGYYGYVFAGMEMSASFTSANVRHAFCSVDTGDYALVPMTAAHVPAALALHDAQPCRCARSEADFIDILRSWSRKPYTLLYKGETVGYASCSPEHDNCDAGELVTAPGHLEAAIKMLVQTFGGVHLCAAPWQTDLADLMTRISEDYAIGGTHAFKFYDADAVREALGTPQGSLVFNGFSLPLPLYVPSPDCV